MNLAPISALQHLLYCERQCALIHLDREWSENRFTAEGRVLHERAHSGENERRPGVQITRGLVVVDPKLRIVGECDIVEIYRDGKLLPVEYKRGKPKAHRADEVQLCAQALALEAMFQTPVPSGYLYYGEHRRRTEVVFDATLRALTLQTIERLHALLMQTALPPARYEVRRCRACSLVEVCQPQARKKVQQWFRAALEAGENDESERNVSQ